MSTTPPNDPGQPGSYPAHPGPSYPGPAYPAPGASPYGQYGPGYGGPMVPRQRPGTVTAAAIITIVMAAITGLGWALIAVVWAAKHDQFESSLLNDQQFSSLNLTRSDLDNIGSAIYVLAVMFALVCLLAIALAVFVLKGRNWARIALVILSAITALLALLAVLGQGWLAIVWLAAAVAVIVLLFAGRAGAWFDSRGYAGDASRAAY